MSNTNQKRDDAELSHGQVNPMSFKEVVGFISIITCLISAIVFSVANGLSFFEVFSKEETRPYFIWGLVVFLLSLLGIAGSTEDGDDDDDDMCDGVF